MALVYAARSWMLSDAGWWRNHDEGGHKTTYVASASGNGQRRGDNQRAQSCQRWLSSGIKQLTIPSAPLIGSDLGAGNLTGTMTEAGQCTDKRTSWLWPIVFHIPARAIAATWDATTTRKRSPNARATPKDDWRFTLQPTTTIPCSATPATRLALTLLSRTVCTVLKDTPYKP